MGGTVQLLKFLPFLRPEVGQGHSEDGNRLSGWNNCQYTAQKLAESLCGSIQQTVSLRKIKKNNQKSGRTLCLVNWSVLFDQRHLFLLFVQILDRTHQFCDQTGKK